MSEIFSPDTNDADEIINPVCIVLQSFIGLVRSMLND